MLDTMVWLSAAVNPGGAPGEIVRLARAGHFRIVTSTAILAEVHDVMGRPENEDLFAPRFDAPEWVEAVVNCCADVVDDVAGPRVSVAPKDDMFCRAAWAGRASHLVSKDPDLTNLKHCQGAQVVGPAAFLKAWRAARRPQP